MELKELLDAYFSGDSIEIDADKNGNWELMNVADITLNELGSILKRCRVRIVKKPITNTIIFQSGVTGTEKALDMIKGLLDSLEIGNKIKLTVSAHYDSPVCRDYYFDEVN
jgi:hypothetical protein